MAYYIMYIVGHVCIVFKDGVRRGSVAPTFVIVMHNIENEVHFVTNCPLYNEERIKLYGSCRNNVRGEMNFDLTPARDAHCGRTPYHVSRQGGTNLGSISYGNLLYSDGAAIANEQSRLQERHQ